MLRDIYKVNRGDSVTMMCSKGTDFIAGFEFSYYRCIQAAIGTWLGLETPYFRDGSPESLHTDS